VYGDKRRVSYCAFGKSLCKLAGKKKLFVTKQNTVLKVQTSFSPVYAKYCLLEPMVGEFSFPLKSQQPKISLKSVPWKNANSLVPCVEDTPCENYSFTKTYCQKAS
jgi:hypothetical protein